MMAADDLREALERLADEWEHPAEVYALRMSAAPRLRDLLDAHPTTPSEPEATVGIAGRIVGAANYPGIVTELFGYLSAAIDDGRTLDPCEMHEYLRDLKRRYVTGPVKAAIAGEAGNRSEPEATVHIDPENTGHVNQLADALIAAMCRQGHEWDRSRDNEVRAHMRTALEAVRDAR